MRVLITGGAGFIGSHLAERLLRDGDEVYVFDDMSTGDLENVHHLEGNPNFHLKVGTVLDREALEPLFDKADIIIPLAALVGAPACERDPKGATTINRDAILMMLDLVSKDHAILMPTTNSAYGTGDKDNYCTEESELRPLTQYAKEKVAIEKALMKRKNSISFRLATVFGMSPRMRIDLLVNDFTYRAVHDRCVVLFESSFKRNYIHILDIARVFIHAINHFERMKGEIYNVGLSDANLSKKELCERIQKQLPGFVFQEAAIGKDPDQRNYVVSNEKIERTEFRPAFSLDDGIKELIKGYTMIKNTRYGNF